MWPWGHAAAGYLLYALFTRVRYDRSPLPESTLALAVGTQFPDLVDKPLAWTLSILPSGRAGAHSLVVGVPLLVVLWWLLDGRDRRRLWGGFAAGYLVHVATDGLYGVLNGELAELGYLLWPITPLPDYSESGGIIEHFLAADLTATMTFEFVIFGLATLLWAVDGAPGLFLLGRWARRRVDDAIAPVTG